MSQILTGLSVWLHALATVILIGHFLLLYLVYLPVLAGKDGSILSEISKRSRLWLYLSLLIFMITGAYLTFIDPNYLGIGNFGNLWGILMLVKHLLILGMLAIGFWFNAILRTGQMLISNTGAGLAIGRFRLYVNLMAISGVLVLLLTAIAQIEQ
jgi:uncharacterized membrane protein